MDSSTRHKRRNLPGTQACDMFRWSPRQRDGALQLQEHIQDLARAEASDLERVYDELDADGSSLVWQYEHMRQFIIELNLLIVAVEDECTVETCPTMTASNEWQFLCAAHRKPQECPAIDYMMHVIEGSTALLMSTKHFPCRGEVAPRSAKFFQSMARRLYRIIAHVYYHHKAAFDQVESEIHLCQRFSQFAMKYKLMCPSMLLVPQDAYVSVNSAKSSAD
mmetsp:Transcript_30496/g.71146  ORF Transcript_30496/g.71146 Transcript_30496/m.71146 type:complete len:221 (-) Transcript_30496:59-721(-)|eukprot:CAMPEP_0178396124 /NCGR_PEP_ID=MMETSP0689_2-20121128/13570_1 /TAXON_ID=160604 /ORGANISM="Amphidinium massartii, Strain CS-259" /LENGTH=220 /DNA_ID=CAMNT_0020016795 /DNA_START=35 /DNA_END=697 /DNA_ORIENTATION=+